MILKSILLSVATIVAICGSAKAAEVKKACSVDERLKLASALQTGEIRDGSEFKSALADVIAQDLGPNCNRLFETSLSFGIPEYTSSKYEISDSQNIYVVSLLVNKVEPETIVLIRRN